MLFFILLALTVKFDAFNAEKNLLFLQIIFRHGDRAPLNAYPKDPNVRYNWPNGREKLTDLGKTMHYTLGKYIRSMYKDFITSNLNEVKVNTSEVDRCIKSAQSHFAGLYNLDPEWASSESIDNDLKDKIVFTPRKQDKMLNTEYKCPRSEEKEMQSIEFPNDPEKEKRHEEVFKNLTNLSGYKVTNEWEAFILHDILFAEKAHNLTIPDWVETYKKDLKEIDDYMLYWMFNSSIVHRLRSGPLIEKLTDMMTNKIEGNLDQQKVQIYSTHDTIVALLLASLKISNFKRPPYAATLLVELREELENEEKKHFIRFLYLNSTAPQDHQESHVLYLRGCPEFCPLEKFKEFIEKENLIPEDVEEECGVTK